MSSPLMVSLLTALLANSGRCGGTGSLWPGCDNGKFLLQRDHPDPPTLSCPVSWPDPIQSLPSIDTTFDPKPASQVCMDTAITYNHSIPNSGMYRPIGAVSGEYLYCPPQRWLNNLHHGATVFLYHPCTPLHEWFHLVNLARSCVTDYIITPHPDLHKHRPLAVVSWGRTLELSSMVSSDVCDWLEKTVTVSGRGDVGQSRKYNLLLTWPAEQHQPGEPEHQSAKSVRRCCEHILFSLLNEKIMGKRGKRSANEVRVKRSLRATRTGVREDPQEETERERENRNADVIFSSTNKTSGTIFGSKEQGDAHQEFEPEYDLGIRSYSVPSFRSHVLQPSTDPLTAGSELQNKDFMPSPIPDKGSHAMEPTHRPGPRSTGPVALKTEPSQKKKKQEPLQPEHQRHSTPRMETNGNWIEISRKQNLTPRSEMSSVVHRKIITQTPIKEANTEGGRKGGEKSGVKDSKKHQEEALKEQKKTDKKMANGIKQKEKDSGKQAVAEEETMKDNVLVDVKEREVENKDTHSYIHIPSSRKKVAASRSGSSARDHQYLPQGHSQPEPKSHHRQPQPVTSQSQKSDCDACKSGDHCDCTEFSRPQEGGAVRSKGMPRTPRTDEAVWAAAALGFLLVLLALSVLHTRLYRHWRTMPSLYWRDPRQDYDSVADVIRRRLRIAERRRKRKASLGRRHECVLLPNSSSDEYQ